MSSFYSSQLDEDEGSFMAHAASNSMPDNARLSPPPTGMAPAVAPRAIATRTHGRRHGPITRVVSPSDIGQLIKPFVFLDYFDFQPTGDPLFGMHPHSGIATFTVLLSGDMRYEDTTGASGELSEGSLEWMSAGSGVWHDGSPSSLSTFRGYQIWVALPPEREIGAAESRYLAPWQVPRIGAARLLLGSYEGVESAVPAPAGMNCLHVCLSPGESWRYQPPAGHDVAWAHVHRGALRVAGARLQDELAVFEPGEQVLEFVAEGGTEFIVASAAKHPHDLVLGRYSVHTSDETLRQGEAQIESIGRQLRARGRI
jgi:redox-sensitive bicupin YhaK (pirin superfamily)